MPVMKLYDLAGAEAERRFSPYCWRTKLALAHKGLAVETLPWRFTDKDQIAFSGQARVPVLVDGDDIVFDSWTIANHLETKYPATPSLFGGEAARSLTRFFNHWTDRVVQPALAPLVLIDIYAHIAAKDRDYFRSSRESAFGSTLEQISADRDSKVAAFRQLLEPLRMQLQQQHYVAGAAPMYADYIVFSAFQWARAISPFKLLAADDVVAHWRQRMLAACGGIAGSAPGYPV